MLGDINRYRYDGVKLQSMLYIILLYFFVLSEQGVRLFKKKSQIFDCRQ